MNVLVLYNYEAMVLKSNIVSDVAPASAAAAAAAIADDDYYYYYYYDNDVDCLNLMYTVICLYLDIDYFIRLREFATYK